MPPQSRQVYRKGKIHSNSPNLISAIVDGGTFEIRQKAAPIVPTAELYPLTIKNAAVLIEHDGEEIHAERNEIW